MSDSFRYRVMRAVAPEVSARLERLAVQASRQVLARMPDEVVDRLATTLRGWTGAASGPANAAWNPSFAPINADLARDLPTLQARGFDNYRNTAQGFRTTEELTLSTIGTGIYPRFAVPNGSAATRKKRSEYIQRHFEEWARFCWPMSPSGLWGLQDLAGRETFGGGEVLVRLGWSKAKLTAGVPLYLDIYPTRLLTNIYDTHGQKNDWGGETVNGIAYNRVGRPVFYFLNDNDPKAANATSVAVLKIPASEILHVMVPLQAGMNRGVPRMAPVMGTVRTQADYTHSMLNRKALENTFVAFITGNDPADMWKAANTGIDARPPRAVDYQGNPVGQMRPAQIVSVENGKQVTINSPSSQSDIQPFYSMINHELSAGTGIPYNRLTGDVTGASFSGERVAMLPYGRLIEVLQQTFLMPQLVRPIVEAWTDAAYLMGIIKGTDLDEFGRVPTTWVYPPLVQADQLTQLKYNVGRVRAGFTTRDDIVISEGGNPEQIDDHRQAEQALWDEKGLTYDCDPRKYSASGNPVQAKRPGHDPGPGP